MLNRKFRLGRIVSTPGANELLENNNKTHMEFLIRHVSGDWGDLSLNDKELNDVAIAHEGNKDQMDRVFSTYTVKPGEKIWVITEADRSSTCLLLPEEY